jgi:hypothetical protein
MSVSYDLILIETSEIDKDKLEEDHIKLLSFSADDWRVYYGDIVVLLPRQENIDETKVFFLYHED